MVDDPFIDIRLLQELVVLSACGTLACCLERGADPNVTLPYEGTLLHCAVNARSDSGIIDQLLAAGARIDALNPQGETPLQLAYRVGAADITQRLWVWGANTAFIGEPTIAQAFLAATTNNLEQLQEAVNGGITVDIRDALDCPLLLRAALFGATSCVLWLLEQGADIEARWHENTGHDNQTGEKWYCRYTALCLAAKANQLLCASALLGAGAQIEPEEVDRSPLSWALHGMPMVGREALVGLLLAHGGDLRKHDGWRLFGELRQEKHLPLLLVHGLAQHPQILEEIFRDALEWRSPDVPALLRQYGYQVNLWDAVLLRDREELKRLIGSGVDVNAPDRFGLSPLWLAVNQAKGRYEDESLAVVDLLLEAGANPLAICHHPRAPSSPLQESERERIPESIRQHLRDFVNQRAETEGTS